ncbi:MAG: MFS transporter [Acidobacteria bacterium]|nr:MAG: MFS transporter [Acidobacteriota bacterium]
MPKTNSKHVAKLAFRFVIIIGIVNLFADMAYEGGRSISGPFLGSLGASATIIGFVAGFGELLGYSLRSISGYFSDKTHRYWIFTFIGYVTNVLAVPALALAGNWPLAAALIVAERTGRAIRKPAVDAMISYAGKSIGRGWVFGLNEGLDQAGAAISPLIVALVLYLNGGYRYAFAVLLIPALLCLATLVVARISHPTPHEMEQEPADFSEAKGFPKAFWIFTGAGALIAAGFADFSLIAFHFQKASIIPQRDIPLVYAVAMGAGALSNLLFGRLFDRIGFPIVFIAFLVGAMFGPMVFLGQFWLASLGMAVWGIGMGAQNSLLKALLATVITASKRSTGFGLFYTCYGVAWFLGSATMGFLYDISLTSLVLLSIALQLLALPIFLWGRSASIAK